MGPGQGYLAALKKFLRGVALFLVGATLFFTSPPPLSAAIPPRLLLDRNDRFGFGVDVKQLSQIVLILSPFVAIAMLWIVTLRRRVAYQTTVLREELQRVEAAEREVARLNTELRRTQREIAFTLGEVIESRSKETANHVRRVAAMSEYLAAMAGLPVEESRRLGLASSMHDIGKIGIPDEILNKPGKLSEEEFDIIRTHTTIGHEILSRAGGPLFDMAARIAYEHHERWDGKGYPRGLKGKDISMEARIVSVVDVFDALSHDRVYKKAWDMERVLDLIQDERGGQFEPMLVDLFLENSKALMDINLSLPDKGGAGRGRIDVSLSAWDYGRFLRGRGQASTPLAFFILLIPPAPPFF